ncbi:prolyl-tRNA synthetase associated domain-containing protein [Chromobacterium amazonense]|uniref:Prolyl-tRNA synthetase associated domain-containing protein n=2 Tax=Chromobacterium amazonense TaxID=1382803 RepID=A0ABU8UZ06_9NEIS|nr:prolyl-tRNA synthetase associated domain-containing protein [Chromobacterium amazonense]MBM2886843.1 prolyl-tRNA synthetase associated domain-containing protein [Chromobacterium amazonense]MDQ4539839.1 prolyl-tRNA synthetase associated domain-containing protein [Chromobacterium amazonense]
MEHALYRLLDAQRIRYQRFEHPPVYTCEEAARVIPELPGAECKNLFLCDAKGRSHFLVAVPAEAGVDIKALGDMLGVKGLRFASPERLKKYLGLEPGSVTLLAAVNDGNQHVAIVVDEALWAADAILCHPLVNTATLSVPVADLARFLAHCGHSPRILAVPRRS